MKGTRIHFNDLLFKRYNCKKVRLFAGESMEGQWDSTRNIYEVNSFINIDCINVWVIIKCGMASFIRLACMCCLHCTCMQPCVHKCMLSAAPNAEWYFRGKRVVTLDSVTAIMKPVLFFEVWIFSDRKNWTSKSPVKCHRVLAWKLRQLLIQSSKQKRGW